MDFDKNQLRATITDARRNRDHDTLLWQTARFICTPQERIVFAKQGVAKMFQLYLGLSKATTHRILQDLQKRKILTMFDEFSLQLNDQFSTKSINSKPYQGERLVYTTEEDSNWSELEEARKRNWAGLGKNKRFVKEKGDDMQALILALTKQLDVKDKQITDLMELVRNIASGEVKPADIKRHLQLVRDE